MSFLASLWDALRGAVPFMLMAQLLLVPFIVLEQLRPAGPRPGPRDYGLNILIAFSSLALAMPLTMAVGMAGAHLRQRLGVEPIGVSFRDLAGVPHVGGALELLAILVGTLLLHDLWFYWAHRIEHRVPLLWEFHKLHHSEVRMNAATWGRDHFLQSVWRSAFPAFTFGLLLDLSVRDAGQAALYSVVFIVALSMFYHSGVRLQLPWLDRVLTTPQVHRIHHSVDPQHHNRNFADFLPLFDIVFGTYHRPAKDEFPETGLGPDHKAPRHILSAQLAPLMGALRLLIPRPGPASSGTQHSR